MPETTLVTILGYVLFVLAAGAALYFWRRRSEIEVLLSEGALRFEALKQQNQELDRGRRQIEEKAKGHKEVLARLEKATAEAREKAAELERSLEAKVSEGRSNQERWETQKGLLERQLERTLENQRRAEAKEQELTEAVGQAEKDARARFEAWRAEESQRYRDLQARFRDMERAKADADAKATIAKPVAKDPAIDPLELTKLKRRLHQTERLFASMRGLREMADERNHNWEVALRKLSHWILVQRGIEPTRIPDAIGPLVGQALQIAGGQLIDDGENVPHDGSPASTDSDQLAAVPEPARGETGAPAHREGP